MPEKFKSIDLPEAVQLQFQGLEKRLLRLETAAAAAISLSALLASYFLLFVSDRFWDTPSWLRLTLLLSALAVLGAAVSWWTLRWIVRRRDLRTLAILVQRKYRRLGDRLLGIVELADEKTRPAFFSPELYAAAIEQVATESGKYNFLEAVSDRGAKRELWTAGGLLILAILPALLVPAAGWNVLRRWLAPLGNVPRFTLVELQDLPASKVVPHGEPFEVTGKILYRSFWHPTKVVAQYNSQETLYAKANGALFRLTIPGQLEKRPLTIKVGDAEKQIAIQPTHRPGLTKIEAAVELPAYLGYAEQKENAQSGSVSLVEGSKLALHGEISRELRDGTWRLADQKPEALSIQGNRFTTAPVSIDANPSITLTWTDILGLTNAAPWTLNLQPQKDSPAVPELPELFRDTAMLETEILQVKTRAHDDFGVKLLGITWVSDAALEKTNSVHNEFKFESDHSQKKELETTFTFSPSILKIPEDSTVEMRAFAIDYFPGRERTETPVFRIHVMGNAKHAELIRQSLESLMVRLEEIARAEEKIASETRQLREAQKADPEQAAKKAKELKEAQEQAAANLKDMSEEGMKTLREALRNPAFSEQTLTEWAKDLQAIEKLGNQEMKEASKSLESAAQASESQGRQENLQQAEVKEDQVLQQLQEMQKKANKELDELQALTLSQRLRKLSGQEKKIEGNLQKSIAETVGLTPQELPGRFQKANTTLAGQQTETQTESTQLQGEISRFFERTQKPNYGEVSREMSKARPDEELDKVRGKIQDNIAMEAMGDLSSWAEKFNLWADKLQPPPEKDEGGGGGSGGGGEQNKDDGALKQLMALLRMRERQGNIESRTQLLNQYLAEKQTYLDGAVLLAASQAKLNQDFTKEAVGNKFAILDSSYEDALTAMGDVENLLDKPRTDELTKKAEDQSIGRISDVINLLNEQAKQSSSNSSSGQSSTSEQMAFLMQMMAPQEGQGMKPGQNSGGNNSGGSTDHVDPMQANNPFGKEGEARTVNKSSGLPQNNPSEFRPALESYFKALEAEQK
jgi:hypothetical protein